MAERFDDIIREYIDFVNEMVGGYMDAMAGFRGHFTRIERQVHRVNRPIGKRIENGETVVVWASYEDPTKPDVIHNRIIRADDYLAANREGGSNEQRHARAILIFLFTYWEDEIRPRLAAAKSSTVNEVKSDIMGDMRILRHAILHAKSVLKPEEHRRLKVVGSMFSSGEVIFVSYDDMHKLFVLIKQDCARLMMDWLGVKDAPISPEEIVDIAIQRVGFESYAPQPFGQAGPYSGGPPPDGPLPPALGLSSQTRTILQYEEFLSHLYFNSLEEREKIFARLQFNIAISITLCAPAVYMLRMMDYQSNSFQLFIIYMGIIFWFGFFIWSLHVVARSITGFEYKEFSDTEEVKKFRKEIESDAGEIKAYNHKYNKKIAFLNADNEVEKFKTDQLEVIVAHNSRINEIRRGGSRHAIGLILAGLPPLLMSAFIFVIYDLDTSSPRKNILIQDTNLAIEVSRLNSRIENLQTSQRRTEMAQEDQKKNESNRSVGHPIPPKPQQPPP